MSKKNKLIRFAKLAEFENVYQNFDFLNPELVSKGNVKTDMKGVWGSHHFKNDKPIILELACGAGEYTLELARRHPDSNFIGVDIKGARIFKGAKIALEENLHNCAFLRTRIELIDHFFSPNEISQIWITFPDPFLKESRQNKRLVSPPFRNLYKKIVQSDNYIHLKTDSSPLYNYTLDTLREDDITIHYFNNDIYKGNLIDEDLNIKTYYEQIHLSNDLTIKYIKFSL